MSWDTLLELAKFLGVPLALALAGVWGLVTGRVIPRAIHEAALAQRDERIREHRERLVEIEKREQVYLEMLLTGTRGLEQAATALKDRRRS